MSVPLKTVSIFLTVFLVAFLALFFSTTEEAQAGKGRLYACHASNKTAAMSSKDEMLTGALATPTLSTNCTTATAADLVNTDYWAKVEQTGNIGTSGNGRSFTYWTGFAGIKNIEFNGDSNGIFASLGNNISGTAVCLWIRYGPLFGGTDHSEYSCRQGNGTTIRNSAGFTSPSNGITGLGASDPLLSGTFSSGNAYLAVSDTNLAKVLTPTNGEIVRGFAIGLRCTTAASCTNSAQFVAFRKLSVEYLPETTPPDVATWDKIDSNIEAFESSHNLRPWTTWSGDAASTTEIGVKAAKCDEDPGSTLSNKALTSNVATLTTSSKHSLTAGDLVFISGVDSTFNGTYTVASVPSNTTFTYSKTASNVASTPSSGSVAHVCDADPSIWMEAADREAGAAWANPQINGVEDTFTAVQSGTTGTFLSGAIFGVTYAVPDCAGTSYGTSLPAVDGTLSTSVYPCYNSYNSTTSAYSDPWEASLHMNWSDFTQNGITTVAVCTYDYSWGEDTIFTYDGSQRYCGSSKNVLFDNAAPTASFTSTAGQSAGGSRVWKSGSFEIATTASDSGVGLRETSVTRATCASDGNPTPYDTTVAALSNTYLDNNRTTSKTDSTTINISSVPDGTSYAYRLTAKDYAARQIGTSKNPGWQYLTTADSGCYSVDNTAPAAGVITAPEYDNDGSFSVSYTAGSDATSGISSNTLTRQSGTLSGGECTNLGNSSASLGATPISESSLSENCYVYTLTTADAAGNTSTSADTVIVDTTAPSAPTITSGPSGATSDNDPSFGFTGEAGATFKCSMDDADFADAASCTSPESYTDLADGSHTFRVWQVDQAGNQSLASSRSFTVDTAAPSAPTITSGPSGETSDNDPSFGFTGEASAAFKCSIDDANFANAASCSSPESYTDLADGSHTFRVWQTDEAGNTSSAALRSFTVDTTAPSAPSVTPVSPDPTNDNTPSISFSGEGGASFQCKVDSGSYASCTSPYTPSPALADGSHTFYVKQTDAAGNTSSEATDTFTVDATAPSAPTITSGPIGLSTDNDPSFGFTGEEGAAFKCSIDDADFADAVTCTSAKSYTDVADGSHTFRVWQTDAAGNTSSAASRSFSIDTGPPLAPTITSGPNGPITSKSPQFQFSGEEGAIFTCTLKNSRTGATLSSSACTSPKTYSNQDNGEYTFEVTQTDIASNVSPVASRNFEIGSFYSNDANSNGVVDPQEAQDISHLNLHVVAAIEIYSDGESAVDIAPDGAAGDGSVAATTASFVQSLSLRSNLAWSVSASVQTQFFGGTSGNRKTLADIAGAGSKGNGQRNISNSAQTLDSTITVDVSWGDEAGNYEGYVVHTAAQALP